MVNRVDRERDDYSRTRVASKFTVYRAPVDFLSLCKAVIPESARYLILDLDRTTHRGVNLGELLGWELAAYAAYGDRYQALRDRRQDPSRFLWDLPRPLRVLRYLLVSARIWAYPGLSYWVWLHLAERHPRLRRARYIQFGPDPITEVQRAPQLTLMHLLPNHSHETIEMLALQVWKRCVSHQVITRSDLTALKKLYPHMCIVLCSASPLPVVQVAARELGVDDYVASEQASRDGYFLTPHLLHPLILRAHRQIGCPRDLRFNAGERKVEYLMERYPDIQELTCVGVSDNHHGEDRSLIELMTHIVDVNSAQPFSPIVPESSRVTEVHSALLMTDEERRAELNQQQRVTSVFSAEQLNDRLAGRQAEIERLGAAARAAVAKISSVHAELRSDLDDLAQAMADAIDSSGGATGRSALSSLYRLNAESRTLVRKLRHLERPVSKLIFELEEQLAMARLELDSQPASREPGGVMSRMMRPFDESALSG